MLESVRALLEGVVDYAGLFPPAGLGMEEAASRYDRYLAGDHAWMLGRFIVPAARLSELEAVIVSSPRAHKWPVAALTGPDLMAAVSAVLAFNAHVRDAAIDSLETNADSEHVIRDAAAAIPDGFFTYFEIPADPDPAPLLAAIAAVHGRAKIRTGGVHENQFPTLAQVARFIRRCDQLKVTFKATAGLHHALRGTHPLTGETDGPAGTMHGFLNVLLAAAFVWAGITDPEMQTMLGDDTPKLAFSSDGVKWGQHWIGAQQIRTARQRLLASFGSCSFEEPITELQARGLL